MARIHYYEFPQGIDPHTRYKHGAMWHDVTCETYPEKDTCKGCAHNNGGGWMECEHAKVTKSDETISGIKISAAKKLLAELGGHAYTRHIDRQGGCFEVTPITLSGNNSRHKYNVHL